MSSGMVISSVDDSIILDQARILHAMHQIYADGAVSDVRPDIPGVRRVDVNAEGEPWFRITWRDGAGVEVNGLPEQNALVAAALRAEIPSGSPRVVAIDTSTGAFVDLTAGISAAQIQAGWRPLDEFEE